MGKHASLMSPLPCASAVTLLALRILLPQAGEPAPQAAPAAPAAPAALAPPAGAGAGPALLQPRDPATPLGNALRGTPLLEGLTAVERNLAAAAGKVPPERVLPPVTGLFRDPWSLPEVARGLTAPGVSASLRPVQAALGCIHAALGMEPPSAEGAGTITIREPQQGIYALDYLAAEARRRCRECLGPLADDAEFHAAVSHVVDVAVATPMPAGEDAAAVDRVLARAATLDLDGLRALAASIGHADVAFRLQGDWAGFEAMPDAEIPEGLRGAFSGTILGAEELDRAGWVVVGGPGPNRYDMSRIAAVFDPGGDDRYEWPAGECPLAGTRVVLDMAGNDLYTAAPGALVGPGGGFFGVGLIRDLEGNDRYEGGRLSLGAACFGAGLLVDEAGDDVYEGGAFSEGAALWGAAALVDCAGGDTYRSRYLSQGVGGPRGVGVLLDLAGNDLYQVGGVPSVYGTPATSCAFSQGVGYGVRRQAAGGVGLLIDRAGDDRYESGEFSQGGGYFFGLGVLRDAAGNDLLRGDRYAQGFAAHQAFGALLEDAGDDTYYGRTAASQGAAWDESAAMLVDAGGDDSYQADGLSQGAAAQQAIGVLADLGGTDRMVARGAGVQGAGGSNEYHFSTCRCLSFSLLFKRGGAASTFSSGRRAGTTVVTGAADDAKPEMSTRWGLFLGVE